MIASIWIAFTSETSEHIFSILSSLITIVVALGGYRLAHNWLVQRNNESAHDAADGFFDELINLPPVLLGFLMDLSRCGAFMCSIDDDVSLHCHNAEAQQRCLRLSEEALMIKLRFFGYFAKTDKRGISVRLKEHEAIERALIQFSDKSFTRFNIIVSRLIIVKNYNEYEKVLSDFNRLTGEIYRFIQAVNQAITPVIGVTFQDYFSFPESMTTGRRQS